MNHCRRIPIRQEEKAKDLLGLLHLVGAVITFRDCGIQISSKAVMEGSLDVISEVVR